MRFDSAAGPDGQFFERRGIPHADEAAIVTRVCFTGEQKTAIPAGNGMTGEVPLRGAIESDGAQQRALDCVVLQPAAGAHGNCDQRAVCQGSEPVRTSRQLLLPEHSQHAGGCIEAQHPDRIGVRLARAARGGGDAQHPVWRRTWLQCFGKGESRR